MRSARTLSRWFRHVSRKSQNSSIAIRRAVLETLEGRKLLAADGFASGVTGGGGGQVVVATTAAEFKSYITQTAALTIEVSGTIDLRPLDGANGRVFTQSNKTIVGIGDAPTVIGNLNVTNNASNVIVQNLYWTNPQDGADGLTIWNGHNVWVDHVSFYDCGDGMCDVNNGSNDVTVSWCKFTYPTRTTHRFTMIADGTSTEKLRITFHHNWWADGCDQRMASSTNAYAHYYDNYFSSTGNYYCSLARDGTEILSQNNYYDHVNNPLYTGTYVTGRIQSSDNIYLGCTGTISPGTDTVFAPSYAYTLDPTGSVPAMVKAGAGVQSAPTVANPAAAGVPSIGGTDFFVNPTGANGAFTSIQAALNAVPAGTATNRIRIYIAPGTYTETSGTDGNLSISKPYVSLIGTGASASDVVIQNSVLSGSTRLTSAATDFVASNLTFLNTTPDNITQALAFRTAADRGVFSNVRFIGFQDTMLLENKSRQYFTNCYVSGDTDFIYGNATAVFDHCTINSSDGGYITAASTDPATANGFVFLDCTLTVSGAAASKPNSVWLGRPWQWDRGAIPSVIFIRTRMGPQIQTGGWNPWTSANTTPDATSRYSEFGSMDASGALLATDSNGVPTGRVSWADPMTSTQAANYTLANIFGPASFWNASTQPEATGVTYVDQGSPWDPTSQLATLNSGPGGSVALSVLGADDRGESGLTYAWSVTAKPVGAATPTFSTNSSNAAKNVVASNLTSGSYTFLATITDAFGLTATSSVTVSVGPLYQNVTARGTGSASAGQSSGPASNAFDGISSTKWYTGTTGGTAWLQFSYASGFSQTVTRYDVTSANDVPQRDPQNWQFQGSNDGVNWTALDTQVNQSFASRSQTNSYLINNSSSYQFYRLNIASNAGGTAYGVQLAELILYAASGAGSAPSVAAAAAVSPSPVAGTSATLSVLGADDLGEPGLSYSWALLSKPTGASDPTFDNNNNNAAKSTTVRFTRAGTYTFRATITDGTGLTTSSDVAVTVSQTLTRIAVTPATATVAQNGSVQLAAAGFDQFGDSISGVPVSWSVDSGGVGTVTSSGNFVATMATGTSTVRATNGAISGTAIVTTQDVVAPRLLSAASRKTHGSAGTFDLSLDLASTAGTVESRKGGATTIVFNFSEQIRALDGVLDRNDFALTGGSFASVSVSGTTLVLSVSGLRDQSKLIINLSGLGDLAGNAITGDHDVVIRNLVGDVDGSGRVDSTDQQLVKNNFQRPLTASNFWFDIDASGTINSTDQQLVKSNLRHSLS